jgi:hypothetical protein
MLATITPLGERSRGFSWRVTVAAFAVGAIVAGTAGGAVLGALGGLLPGRGWRDAAALGVLAVALGVDATGLRRRLPTTRRQVNEDWMARYRGWVYGVAFGAQLGVGVVTVVTSAAIYAAAAGALLCGTAVTGGLVGGAFGLVRAASVGPARIAGDPAGLARLHAGLDRLAPWGACLVVVAELLALGIAVAVLA